MSFVVNYTLDLTTQFDFLDRFSIEATLNLGDRGRVALAARVDELYLAGVEAYAEGALDEAIEYWLSALENWDENDEVPDAILATHPLATMETQNSVPGKAFTRPVCPYPKVARYKGSGNADDASSFSCAAPQ